MKRLLLMFIISICIIGYRSESIMNMIGLANPQTVAQTYTVKDLTVSSSKQTPVGMTMLEYAELSKTDPRAFEKFSAANQIPQERAEIDKLMNFFTRLKYE